MDIKTFFLSGIIFFLLDMVYLSSHTSYFQKIFKGIQNSKLKLRYESAFICYIFLVLSVNYFILDDNKKNLKDSFILGLCIYGVYETTNYATFDKWPVYMVIADTIWGGVLFASTVYLTRKIKSYYKL